MTVEEVMQTKYKFVIYKIFCVLWCFMFVQQQTMLYSLRNTNSTKISIFPLHCGFRDVRNDVLWEST